MFSTAAGSLGRALSAVTLSLALSIGYLTVEALPARAATTHEIYDQGLADCVAAAIPGYSGDGFTFADSDLLTITTLDCSGRDIYDLTGLVGLRNVTTANFSGNQISDLTGIDELFAIQNLNLANNQISDVSPLALWPLLTLDISGNHVLDLHSLQGATNLTSVTATGQTASWTIAPNQATALPLVTKVNTVPATLSSSDASLTFADGAATGTTAGVYTITFSDTHYGVTFGGTLTTTVDAGPVTIPDEGFAACLDDKLGVTGNIFGSVELATITSLDCSYRNISDLTGASALRDATSLDFSHNAITNAGPIGANAALKTLNLSYNQLQTLNAVPSMQVESLNVSNNRIADISPLSVITTLTTLDASGQSLEATVEADTATDLTVLDWAAATPTFSWPTGVTYDAGKVTAAAGIYSVAFSSTDGTKTFSGTLALSSHAEVSITDYHLSQCIAIALDKAPSTATFSNLDLANIVELTCARQSVNNLDGLQYLTGLVYLDINHNSVSDLSPISGLTHLYSLDVSYNSITDLAPLTGLTTLSTLTLDNNIGIKSIAPLSSLTALGTLKASSLSLTSLSGVESMSNLYGLTATNNQLTSLTPLVNLARLQTVDVSNNQLTSVAELINSKATTRLKTLKLSGNQISSLSGLTKLTALSTLEAANNKISDLTPLASLTKLIVINLSNNKISSLSGLGGLKYVLALKVSGNQLTSVSTLSGYTMLSSLEIYDNQLTDLSPLSGLSSLGIINARNQHPVLAVYPTTATPLVLKNNTGADATLGTLPSGVSVDAGALTAAAEGSYAVPFGSGDYDTDYIEFSGTLTVNAAYNTFTTQTPTITGTPKVDSTLTAHTGTWSPEPTFTYQWNADGAPISGATESTFVPTGAEVGKAITVTVTGTKDTYASTPVTSAATDAVAQATFTAPSKVTVSGWYTVGETLTASATWTPTPDSVTYTWLRDDVPIDGATAATYTLAWDDVDHSIAARIAVSKSGYVDDALTSSSKTVAEGVTFPDANLRLCISTALNSYPLVFTNQQLASLTSLDCSGYTITDLTGMDALTGLTSLNLRGNAIADFSPISSLTGLQSLDVSYTGLTNLNAFSGLTGLTSLDASHNAITDISGISGLTGLTTLDLSSNEITSLAALSNLTALTTLAASANRISDLSPLTGLSALATPEVTGQNPVVRGEADQATTNPVQGLPGGFTTYSLPDGVTLVDGKFTAPAGVYSIPFSVATEEGGTPYFTGYVRFESHTDVFVADPGFASCLASALSLPSTTQTFSNIDLTGIYDLDCAGRGIFSIDGAQYLTLMASADFSNNRIDDLSPLSGLTALTALNVGDNDVNSTSALAGLTGLQNLDLSGNSVTDLSPLSSMTDLRIVDVSANSLSRLDGLGNHANLLTVTASGNSLTSLAPLSSLPRLTTLDVSNNQLTSLSELSTSLAKARLKTLTISGNRISSISTLSSFTKLATLRAANNKISDLTPLTSLSQLLEVDVTNNQVTSLAGLSGHAVLITVKASGNQLTSVSQLSGLGMLNWVEVYDNHIADISPLAALVARDGILNARGQTVTQSVVPQVATAVAVTDASGVVPTLGTLPDGLSVDAGNLTASAEGTYPVTFVSGDYAVNRIEFSGTLTVTAAYNAFTTATPTITGTPKVGLTLTAHPGTWSPEPTFAYQWKADGADIVDATAATFTPTSMEAGKAITVTVTGSKDTYASVSLTSAATELVANGTFTAPSQITVSGTFAVGETVTAAAGTWSPVGTISYQWLRDGVAISGATDAEYALTTDDAGKAVSVRVSASAPGYDPGSVQSTATSVALGTMYGDAPIIVVPGNGQMAIGKELMVGTGYWNPSPHLTIQWYRAGYPIAGATGWTYTVTTADVGKAITVSQTSTVTGYTTLTKLSDPTPEVPAGSFTAPSSVDISGTMAVGQTLTADAGTWTPTPDTITYQWLRDGDPISGATGVTYLLTPADKAAVVTVKATVAATGYTTASLTSTNSAKVVAGSFVSQVPTITGTPTFGSTLKASVAAWSPVANLDWQWLRNGADITGATGTNYTLTTADIGKVISVRVVGSLNGYLDTAETSSATEAVAPATFTGPTQATVSGDLAVGRTLSVDPVAFAPVPDAVSYQWFANGSPIEGADKASYLITSSELNATITVAVTASKAGYDNLTVASVAGDPVAANAFAADAPVISGSPVVDATLTVTSGGWAPTPTTLTYQWQADGVDITDATDATFVITPAQRGKAITVVVTGELAGYADKTVTSAATAKVAAAELVGSTSVTVSGDAIVGSTLTASDVSWTPAADAVVYQWLRGGVAIDGANGQNYVLTAADKNKVVTVSVTATKDGYRTVVLHSVAADPVSPATFTADTPVITGSPVVDQTLTADFGNWTPIPTAGAIEWKRDGKVIDGATSDTYLVTSADVGAKITVSLLGGRDGYADHTATSAATDPVATASFTAPAEVTVSGTGKVGEFLNAQAGTWTPTPTTVSYQWLRDGDVIEGATSTSSYLLTPADAGHVITVTVSVTKDGYTAASLTSAAGDAVAVGTFTAPEPTISGTPMVDETLTASTSAWTPSPSAVSYQWLADGAPISGATGLTYKVGADELGKAITFAVTGTKTGYADTTVTSAATGAVEAATLLPPKGIEVTGSLTVGATLSVEHGSWSPAADGYSYRWLRNGVAIENATTASYTLGVDDLSAVITAEVTAHKAGYSDRAITSADGEPVAVGQFQTLSPWISGNALVGSTLTANVGYWAPEPSQYTYQWNADSEEIPGATSSTFMVTTAQAGKVISLSVTGSRDGYQTVTVNTGGTDTVPTAEFSAPAEVTVSGDYVVGSTLTADAGTWSPTPTSLTYQWLRGSTEIADATASTYALTPADKGKVITVKVTATLTGYRTTTLRSAAAEAVAPATFTTATPTISGTASVGQELTVTPGTWSPVPTSTSVQWKRDGKAIEGATGTTYTVTLDDANAKLSVTVSGTKDGYADASASSAETETVAAGQFTAPAKATVSGERVVGQTLTADAGTWTPTPTLAYQWLRNGTPITDAHGATYTVTADDVDADLTVEVTGSAHGYADLTIASDGATVVAKGVITASQPVILGQAQVGRTLIAKAEGWTPTPDSFSYQWYLNGEAIDGATEATYTIGESEVGASLTVTVTGTRDGYHSTAAIESDPVEVSAAGHFASPEEISVSGDYVVGGVLTAAVGTWNPAPVTVSYQWLRSGKVIDNATEAEYRLTAEDTDKVITVKVTGEKPGFVTTAVRSSAPAAVARGSFTTAMPTLSGVPQIGQTLSVDPGTWTPAATAVSYQWYRSGIAISGATGSSYTIVAADVWQTISVSVTGARDGYNTATTTAAATPVPQGVLAGPNPAISGKAKVKKTIKVVLGTWSPSPDAVSYQWYRNGKAIKKATKSSYKLTKSDKGKRITVKVTVSKAGYATRALTSAKTAKVK